MTAEETLVQMLRARPDLTAIVGNKIYPLVLPKGATYPAVCYQRISRGTYPTQSGAGSLRVGRFQINCYADKYTTLKTLVGVIEKTFDFPKITGPAAAAEVINVIDDFESNSQQYKAVVEINLWTQEI